MIMLKTIIIWQNAHDFLKKLHLVLLANAAASFHRPLDHDASTAGADQRLGGHRVLHTRRLRARLAGMGSEARDRSSGRSLLRPVVTRGRCSPAKHPVNRRPSLQCNPRRCVGGWAAHMPAHCTPHGRNDGCNYPSAAGSCWFLLIGLHRTGGDCNPSDQAAARAHSGAPLWKSRGFSKDSFLRRCSRLGASIQCPCSY